MLLQIAFILLYFVVYFPFQEFGLIIVHFQLMQLFIDLLIKGMR